jgi:Zn-dependent protease with chaperone function
MSNPGLGESLVFICLAVITGIPFYFKVWLDRERPVLQDRLDRRTNLLSGMIFIALFAGAFLYPRHSWKVAQLLLGASILSFSILYQTRGRYLARMSGQIAAKPEASFRQSAARMCIGLILCAAFSWNPLLILIAPVLVPFLMPAFLRLQYATQVMADSPLRQRIERAFADSGVPLSRIQIIDETGTGSRNAFITGTGMGRGAFGRTLFIGLGLFEILDDSELHAVVLHEAAHVRLHHLRNRGLAALGLFILCSFWTVIPAAFLFPGDTGLLVAAFLMAGMAQMWLLGRVIHRQELEADREAVSLGAGSDALARALVKLDTGSIGPYPRLEERLSALRDGLPADSGILPQKSFLSAYSMLVIGVVLWSAQNLAPKASNQASIARSELDGARR